MAENFLDHPIAHAESCKVPGETASETMPPAPQPADRRMDHPSAQIVEVQRSPFLTLERELAVWGTLAMRFKSISRKRREVFDWINELATILTQVWAVRNPRQAEIARRLAVETRLQRNGLITVSQNPKVLPIFPEKFVHN